MRFLLVGCFFFLSIKISAQRYSFVEYSTEEGLPQTQVKSIAQDKSGYIWVGTLGGLARFNGKDFISYTREDGLVNNKIISLAYLNETLWVGHEGGISKRVNNKFISWSLPSESKNVQVTQIIQFGKKIIIATNGQGLFELTTNGFKPVSFEAEGSNRIRDILYSQGKYFLATRNGVYYTSDFKKFYPIQQTLEWTISNLTEFQGEIAITSFQDGIHLFNASTQKLKVLPVDPEMFLASAITNHKGQLWIASAEGIIIYDGKTIRLINENRGMPLVSLNQIFEDDEHNIWIGSDGKGLICFSGEEFVHHNESTGLPSDLVINVNQDKSGQFWISTFNKGLVLQKTNGEFQTIYDRIPNFWCSLMEIDGLNWFGTDMGLLAFHNTQLKHTFTEDDALLGNKITSLFKISKTAMYLGGSRGLMKYESGKFTTLHDNDNYDIGTIRDIEIHHGVLYVATDKGLYQRKNNTFSSVDNFSKTTFCMIIDNHNKLWLGTEEGLYALENGNVVNHNFASETASKFINFLNFRNGKIYIGTNNGLYTYNVNEKNTSKKIEHFGIQEGVVNLETNLNSSFIDRKGRLWFGTASGLVIYEERETNNIQTNPRLLLKDVLLNYEKSDFSTTQLQSGFSLPYSKNNISFEFDGISFSNPKELKYQFWLEGGEQNWSPPTSNPTVNFTSLPAGDYTLHARAIGQQNNLSDVIITSFTIRAPFYQTWWFIGLCALIIGSLIYLFVRLRIKGEREKSAKETVVIKNKLLALEQQSLNASMNRHFIFNSLNSIQYFINTQDKNSANKYLTNFAQLIRKNLDSSTSEGSLTSFSKEIERLQLYLSLESMRFKDRFEYSFEINVPEAESILIPSMLLQPYIENCIVHGILPKKHVLGKIKLQAWTENQILMIRIEDNGVGISQSLDTKKNFDGDHKSQGMEITSKRISLIKQMSNQSFEIIGPDDLLDENRSINGTYVLLKIPYEDFEN
jgi:ligand-binding sensor domain-containing protein